MAVKNSLLMQQLWLEGGSEYQQRIPSPSVASVRQQISKLWEPGAQAMRNIFVDGLFNRVGLSYVRNKGPWKSPLDQFIKRDIPYGSSVLEAQVKLIRGRQYLDDRETLLKLHRPEIAQCVHSVNFNVQYPYAVNMPELRRAADSEYGLNEFVAGIMDAAITSMNYDVYKTMMQLFAEYMTELGMYSIHCDDITDDDTAKTFLQKLREISGLLQFPSGKYMAQNPDIQGLGLSTWISDPSEIVAFMTPATKSKIDVLSLAGTFHTELADVESKIVLVDEFPIPDVFCVITTREFFQVYNDFLENGSFYNPETLNQQYYLTRSGIMSVSPFVPAVAFTTGAGTVDGTITQTVTTNQLTNVRLMGRNENGNLELIDTSETPLTKAMVDRGVYVVGDLDGTLSLGDVTGAQEIDGVTVSPDAVVVTGITLSGTGAPALNSRTFVDMNSKLHLQAGAYKTADGLTATLTYTTAYTNPSGTTPEPVTGTFSFEVAGSNFNPGPEPQGPNLSDYVRQIYIASSNLGIMGTPCEGTALDAPAPSLGSTFYQPDRLRLERLGADTVSAVDFGIRYTRSGSPAMVATQAMELVGGTQEFLGTFSLSGADAGSTAYVDMSVTTPGGVIEKTFTFELTTAP